MLKYFRPKHCGSCWWIRLWPRCPIHPVKRSLNFKVKSCSLKLTKMYFYRDHILTSCSMHRQNTTLFYSPLSGRTILLTRVSLLRLSLQLSLSFHFLVSVSVSLSLSLASRGNKIDAPICVLAVCITTPNRSTMSQGKHTHTQYPTLHIYTHLDTLQSTHAVEIIHFPVIWNAVIVPFSFPLPIRRYSHGQEEREMSFQSGYNQLPERE